MHELSYGRLCTEIYDLDKPEAPPDKLDSLVKTRRKLDSYIGHLEKASGPVLEPMCGSGRFLIPLLERGTDIDGVDASPDMLDACRRKGASKGLEPVLYQQALQELSLPRRYGFMFIPYGSFGLIVDRQEAADSLKRLYEHLLPGGKLVLDVETPRAASKPAEAGSWGARWGGGWVTRADGAKIVLSHLNTYDADDQLQESVERYELFKNGRLVETELEDFTIRFYERDEFQLLLEQVGFVGIRASRAGDDAEPSHDDDTIVFECSRPGG